MFANLGFTELLVIAMICGVVVWPAWRIIRKAGYPGVLALGLFVPLVNIALVLFLAFSDWPVERKLRMLQSRSGPFNT